MSRKSVKPSPSHRPKRACSRGLASEEGRPQISGSRAINLVRRHPAPGRPDHHRVEGGQVCQARTETSRAPERARQTRARSRRRIHCRRVLLPAMRTAMPEAWDQAGKSLRDSARLVSWSRLAVRKSAEGGPFGRSGSGADERRHRTIFRNLRHWRRRQSFERLDSRLKIT